jgi:hypothetical protein
MDTCTNFLTLVDTLCTPGFILKNYNDDHTAFMFFTYLRTNSNFCLIQHFCWFCITKKESVYCTAYTESLYKTETFHLQRVHHVSNWDISLHNFHSTCCLSYSIIINGCKIWWVTYSKILTTIKITDCMCIFLRILFVLVIGRVSDIQFRNVHL